MKASERQVTNEGTCSVRLVQRVAIHPKLNTTGASAKEGLENHGESSFPAMHAGVEEADCLLMVRLGGLDRGLKCLRV